MSRSFAIGLTAVLPALFVPACAPPPPSSGATEDAAPASRVEPLDVAPTTLGVWSVSSSQIEGDRLPPGTVLEFSPFGLVHVDEAVTGRTSAAEFELTADGSIALHGPRGLFRDDPRGPGLWEHDFEGRELHLRRGSEMIVLTRDTDEVRRRNGGYTFTESAQRLRADATERLRRMGVALVRYSIEHDGAIAPELEDVAASGSLDPEGAALLRSPLGPVAGGGDDYWLTPPVKPRGPDREPRTRFEQCMYPAQEILVYDRASYAADDRVHVLFFDGHVEVVSRQRFATLAGLPCHEGVEFNPPPVE